MHWIVAAFLAPVLYAAGNYTDKALLSKYLKGGGVGTILLFSSLLGTLTLPIIYLIEPAVFSLTFPGALLPIFNGGLTVIAVLFYLYAIENDEISLVVPILQLIPVFGYIIAFIILGETLTFHQIIGSVIIIIGAVILSSNIDKEGKVHVNRKVLILAAASAFVFALSGTIFKFVALELGNGYWTTQFWEYVGIAILGLFFFVFIKKYRDNFLAVFQKNKVAVIGLNVFAEVVMVSGDLLMNFASLFAPIAIIYVINSFQPAFVFLYGVVLTLIIPHIIKESLDKRDLSKKILTITAMIIGGLLLYF